MRVTQGGVSLWYGTPDAPAPSGTVAAGADTSITVGLQPPDPHASVTVLYRINHGAPHTIPAPATHHDTSGKQYFRAQLSGFKPGDKVEYVAIYRSGAHQIPSNQEAETHVATFNVGPPHASTPPTGAHGPTVDDPKEALRAVLHASAVLGSKTLEDSFIKSYFDHHGGAQDFWTSLAGHAEFKPHIERLQLLLQVDMLVSGHLPLIEALLKLPGVKSMRDLARLDETDWQQLIAKSGAPTHIGGVAPAAQAALLTASIVATLQAAFPTMTVERIATASHRVDPLASKFLDNSADLDIRTARLDAYAADHAATAFQGIPANKRDTVLKEVKRLQRLFSVSTNAATFRGLLETSLDSAHAIAVIPRATFISHYGPMLGGQASATQVHERAQFIDARNINLRSSIHDAIHTPPTRGLGHHSQAQMLRTFAPHSPSACPPGQPAAHAAHLNLKPGSLHEDLVKQFPNSAELFGSLSLCNCEECESAIGPAAYLVDVLDFLGHSKPNPHGATPLDVLIGDATKKIAGRRPDLAYMNLTCSNTNTAMPYVDIVNEVLESYVSLGMKLDGSTARDTADATTAELDATPQYLNQHAYELLDRAVYPFQLPFNRPLLVTRSYLGQLGTSRYELLETFQKDRSTPLVKRLLAAEQLDLSAEEFQILTGQHIDPGQKIVSRPEAEFYGYHGSTAEHPASQGDWLHELPNVATLLQRTGLSYAELSALLATSFISPKLVVDDHQGLCNTASMRLRHQDGRAPDAHDLARIHRFIRLYRRCGWSVTDLDRALSALRAVDMNADVLIHLAHVKKLQAHFHVKSLQTLLALWGPIDARGADSLYRNLFLNKAMQRQNALIDVAFAQDTPDSPVLTHAATLLQDHLQVLASAYRISALDMDLLLADCGLNTPGAILNLQNISALYRRAALAKALRLKVRDFLGLKTLWGSDPFASPEATMEFSAVAADIAHSGLSAGKLGYVLRHVVGTAAGETEPQEAAILALARTVREGLAAIAQDNIYTKDPKGVAKDPSGAVTAEKLALLYDGGVVDEFVGIVNGVVNYSTSLITLPVGVTVPPALQKKLSYNPVSQLLSCKSPLTGADKGTLFALSNDQTYQAAVQSLYQQPLEVIVSLTKGFLDPEDAKKTLVTGNASVDTDLNPIQLDAQGNATADPAQARTTAGAAKFEYVLRSLLPYLVTTLGAALLKRTIGDALKISDETAQGLLGSLKSVADPTRSAHYDLHSLQSNGLSATHGAMASWSGWIAAPGSGDFEFMMRTTGSPTIWVGDPQSPLPIQASGPGEWTSGKITLKVRQPYYLRVDVAQPASNPSITLLWQSLTVHKSIVPDSAICPADRVNAFRQTFLRLHKAAVLINTLKPTDAELSFLAMATAPATTSAPAPTPAPATTSATAPTPAMTPAAGTISALDFNQLPISRGDSLAAQIDAQAPHQFSAWLRAARLVALRKELPGSDTALTQVFSAATWEAALKALVAVSGWDESLLRDLTAGFGLQPADLRSEPWIFRLTNSVRLAQRLGVSARNLFAWATAGSDYVSLEKIGQAVRKSVQGQYDAETWLTVAKPLNDKLRDTQRNALIAYLLPRMALRDSDQLFEYFLIDADMGVCTETSRISLAHSSVQLFVQRCLMNLEDTGDINAVSPHQIDADQWDKWRRHYRFWQANYEVLLMPEHWMEQGLRDDKTPFFVALEGDLTQQEVTAENVETAYLNYLEKLEQVARLEIIGTFWQDRDPDSGEEINTLHIFGRTFHAPHTYFYRQFVNFATWTPWEEMQVTIEGDHLMPLIWNRRLYVFWPVFSKKSTPPDTRSIDTGSKSIPLKTATPFWQVSLAWTELRHNKWSPKQVSKKAFDMGAAYFVEDDPARYAKYAYSFKTSMVGQPDGGPPSLLIRCVFHGPTVSIRPWGWFFFIEIKETTEVVGAFEMGGCTGESVEPVFGTMPWPNPIAPPEADVEALTFVLDPRKHGLTLTSAANHQTSQFLSASPTPYRLLYPHQFADYLLQAPLFYQDKHSTFLASPLEEHGAFHQVATPAHAAFQRGSNVAASRAQTAASHGTHAATAGHAATASHAHSQTGTARQPRHTAPNDVSNALVQMENTLMDIGERYAKHAGARGSAWGTHAVSHNTHAPGATKLRFETFYHPFVCDFMKSITRLGVPGLLTEDNQRRKAHDPDFFLHRYKPTGHVTHPLPTEIVDFDHGPYAMYNQELFFHIPDLIHERLFQNRRYDEAIRWLKFIFDPTDDSHGEAAPQRYWKYLPFKTSARENVQQLLSVMESGDPQHSQLIADWAKNPFRPYAVARHRMEAYKKNIFIKYVRTLIQHGDALFLSDSKEAINEAHQLYTMAKHMLGPKPEAIAPQTKPTAQCYASLRGKLDIFSAGLAQLENEYPFSGKVTAHPKADGGGMQNLGRTLYFCAPPNTKLLELWRIVDDRLYKIRHCMNFQGVVRQLSLFDPPIDPGQLVRAAAAGLDLGSVMADTQTPLPAYRFTYMLQKAREMCNECRTFGNALLSALEKNDGETLAVMRATHEVGILDLMHRVKIRQLDEANAQVDSLSSSRNTALQRYGYYQTLMGVSGGGVPAIGETIPMVPVPSQPGTDVFGIQLIPEEGIELALTTGASILQASAAAVQTLSAVLHVVPQMGAHVQPMGPGASVTEGGTQLGGAGDSAASTLRIVGDIVAIAGTLSGKMGSYFRRQADWTLQNNLAACEIMQIDKQIAAANIRAAIAQHELDSQERQMRNAGVILDFMTRQKFTNQDLYGWMVSDTSASYFTCYQMAISMAKKAERAFRFERGLTDSNFIQFGYWDSLRKGLLAAERLHLALLQLDAAYTDQNTREDEISRDVSIVMNAPLALISLKETGRCEIDIPESFFDADNHGHFRRRIKHLSLTIPCVVGPYTSLNCRLTLLTNKTRISNDPGDTYAEDIENGDERFVNNFAAVQSIATSHGLNDSGMFEVNFRDERYLPFEGAGVISRWRIELPKENNAFDFETLSDVVLHFKYTARDGGEPLRQASRQALASADSPPDVLRLFSVRHEFRNAWHRFLNPNPTTAAASPLAPATATSATDAGAGAGAAAGATQAMSLDLTAERFPFKYRGKTLTIAKVELFLSLRPQVSVADYAAAKPLKVSLTPPGGTPVDAVLKSDKAILNGMPHATVDVSDQTAGLGAWTIEVKAEDLAGLPASMRTGGGASKAYRLKAEGVMDLMLVYHYSVG